MYCRNCGRQFKDGEKFCGNCGTPNINNVPFVPPNNTTQSQEDKNMGNLLTLLSFLLFFAIPAVFSGLGIYQVNGISYLAALTLLIYTRIKYPQNIFAKVLMWLVIIFTIIMIIFVIVFMISCSIALRDCNGAF